MCVNRALLNGTHTPFGTNIDVVGLSQKGSPLDPALLSLLTEPAFQLMCNGALKASDCPPGLVNDVAVKHLIPGLEGARKSADRSVNRPRLQDLVVDCLPLIDDAVFPGVFSSLFPAFFVPGFRARLLLATLPRARLVKHGLWCLLISWPQDEFESLCALLDEHLDAVSRGALELLVPPLRARWGAHLTERLPHLFDFV